MTEKIIELSEINSLYSYILSKIIQAEKEGISFLNLIISTLSLPKESYFILAPIGFMDFHNSFSNEEFMDGFSYDFSAENKYLALSSNEKLSLVREVVESLSD